MNADRDPLYLIERRNSGHDPRVEWDLQHIVDRRGVVADTTDPGLAQSMARAALTQWENRQ